MAKKNTVAAQIIGSFEAIGKQVGSETVKVPGEVVGAALESLGAKSAVPGKSPTAATPAAEGSRTPDAFDTYKIGPSDAEKALAREALKALSERPKPKELPVYERNQREAEQNKENVRLEQAAAAKQQLPDTGARRGRGDLYGMAAKKTSTERKGFRQD